MTDKFRDKYRIPSARATWWDYNNDGLYFVTVCVTGKQNYFGEIVNNEMILSNVGEKACQYWLEIPVHFPFVELDVFIIMPDHIHGIIAIVETLRATSLQTDTNRLSAISPKYGSLSSVIRSYKSALTKWCNMNNITFGWQTRFYDHIIRDDSELNRIRKYICDNPANWQKDNIESM